jgi:DNA invertase Pin-like site-specific DNA recombinase
MAMVEAGVKRKHARIVSAAGEGTDSDEPSAILMRRMVDAFAEYERLLIGARTKAALAGKRSRGERIGSIPYGYQLAEAGQLVECSSEQETIKLVRMLRGSGLSYRKIADELTARGMRPRGSSWHAQTIKNICEAQAYGQAVSGSVA